MGKKKEIEDTIFCGKPLIPEWMPDRGSIKGGHIAQIGKIKENLLQKLTPRLEGVSTLSKPWLKNGPPLLGKFILLTECALLITPIELHRPWASKSQMPLLLKDWWGFVMLYTAGHSAGRIAHTKAEGKEYTKSQRLAWTQGWEWMYYLFCRHVVIESQQSGILVLVAFLH